MTLFTRLLRPVLWLFHWREMFPKINRTTTIWMLGLSASVLNALFFNWRFVVFQLIGNVMIPLILCKLFLQKTPLQKTMLRKFAITFAALFGMTLFGTGTVDGACSHSSWRSVLHRDCNRCSSSIESEHRFGGCDFDGCERNHCKRRCRLGKVLFGWLKIFRRSGCDDSSCCDERSHHGVMHYGAAHYGASYHGAAYRPTHRGMMHPGMIRPPVHRLRLAPVVPPPGTLGWTYRKPSRLISELEHPRTGMLEVYDLPQDAMVDVQGMHGYRDRDGIWRFKTNRPLIPGVPHVYEVHARCVKNGRLVDELRVVRLIRGRIVDLSYADTVQHHEHGHHNHR